jgi:hypothetical protein
MNRPATRAGFWPAGQLFISARHHALGGAGEPDWHSIRNLVGAIGGRVIRLASFPS